MKAVNDMISTYATMDQRLQFIDVSSPMIGADGNPREELFWVDGLHLSNAGYDLWTSIVRPVLMRDLAEPDSSNVKQDGN